MTVKYTLCVNKGGEETFISCPGSKHTQAGIWINSFLKTVSSEEWEKEREKKLEKEKKEKERQKKGVQIQ